MKILLISPGTADEIDNKNIREIPYLYSKAFIAPHAVASVAALTPSEHNVEIHDEYIRGSVEEFLPGRNYDIIGVSITSNQVKRCLAIAKACRKYCPSALVVAGGIGVEMLIKNRTEDIDVVFHGEAEETWPVFLEDLKKGNYQNVYKNVHKPDMTSVPPPRWELIREDIRLYNSVSVQTTRGCPFDCSFCDVIYTYGRKPRSKSVDQVLDEIKKLSELKVEMVFIADDNFVGDRKYVKELLSRLIILNNSFPTRMIFYTQLDITIAKDDELLHLMSDANFYCLMIGIESINPDSLKDMNKTQNLGINAVEAIKKIQSYGIMVLAHMIIGNDSDDNTVFQQTADFVKEADIVFHICHPLAAPPGTKMWYEYKRQGRILHAESGENSDKLDIISNIIPKQMSRQELFEGLANYWDDIYNCEKFEERAINFIKGIRFRPKGEALGIGSFWAMRKLMFGVLKYYLFTAEKKHRKAFWRIMKLAKKDTSYFVPKIIYMFTVYQIDYKRSIYDSRTAREYAKWERDNPHLVTVDNSVIPVGDNIRNCAAQLISEAYKIVSAPGLSKEVLYSAILKVMLDFNDRFGEDFETLDEFYKEQIRATCERVIIQDKLSQHQTKSETPSKQPVGLTREIIDALDNAVRYRNLHI